MDGDTTSLDAPQQAAPSEEHNNSTIISRIRSYFAPLAGFVLRNAISSIITAIVVPPSAITTIVFIYAIVEDLPPLSVIDELGAHIAVVAIVSVALFMMILTYASLPTAIQFFNNKSGSKDDSKNTLALKVYSMGASCGLAIVLYTCISVYILDISDVAKYTTIFVLLLLFMMLSIAMSALAAVLHDSAILPNKLSAIFISNFVSLIIMTLVYMAMLIAAASKDESTLNLIYNYLQKSHGDQIAHIFASALIVVVPIVSIIIVTINSADIKKAAGSIALVSLFLICIWPGAFGFLSGAFRLLKKGGNIPVVLWVETDTACRHKDLMDEPPICDAKERSNNSQKMRPLKLSFIDKDFLYFKCAYDVPDGRIVKAATYESMLLIPRKEVSSILFLDKERESTKPSS